MRNNFIPISAPDLSGNEKKYLLDCLESSWISSKGKYIDLFEEKFAKFIGSKYAITTSNGTTALHLVLTALGIGKGDEVIIPDLTFVATANAVIYTGATPVFVDVDKDSWNINPSLIRQALSPKTKAIIPVHLYGNPAEMGEILKIARDNNIYIIEDAAEAHGAQVKMDNWKKTGSMGYAGIFSFYGNKIITSGEGGMIVTNNKDLAQKIRIFRDHGQEPGRRYYHKVVGFNYRMTNLQAAIGVAQLERINKFLKKKKVIANLYKENLKDIKGLQFPLERDNVKNIYWMFSIIIKDDFPVSRDKLHYLFQQEQIETRPFFYPLNLLPPYLSSKRFIISEYLSSHGISLPSSVNLTKSKINRITDIIKKAQK